MNVNKSDIPFVFEDFKKSIMGCDFYAVDQEMTGVNFEEQHRSWTMSLPELYEGCRGVVNRYIAFQFGVSIFTFVKEGVYEVKSYNFYLLNKFGDFAVDGEAVAFLALHKMDFQNWFLSGMPYCDGNGEKRLRAGKPKPIYSEVQEKIALYIVGKIEEWYFNSANAADESVIINSVITKDIETQVVSILEKRKIDVSLQYKLKLFRYDLPTDILVSRVLRNEVSSMLRKNNGRLNDIVLEELGFREFWKCLTECKKPVIGHHFWLDLMFMVHMHENSLPPDYEAYKNQVHELFPCVYDTKTLSRFIVLDGVGKPPCLQKLYKECCKLNEGLTNSITFYLPPGFHCYDDTCTGGKGKAHEAGYDAYMTGVVFAIIKNVYMKKEECQLRKWENIVSVFGSFYSMNLSGNDFLGMGAIFLLEFEKEVDMNLVWSLMATNKDIDDADGGEGIISFDIKPGFKFTERGKIFVVQFSDEAIDEETVKSRIESSTKRLNIYLRPIIGEEVSIVPRIKSIKRFR